MTHLGFCCSCFLPPAVSKGMLVVHRAAEAPVCESSLFGGGSREAGQERRQMVIRQQSGQPGGVAAFHQAFQGLDVRNLRGRWERTTWLRQSLESPSSQCTAFPSPTAGMREKRLLACSIYTSGQLFTRLHEVKVQHLSEAASNDPV